MWSDTDYSESRPSFPHPVLPPAVAPDAGPCICVSFNPAYQPLICGALQQLAQDATWTAQSDTDRAVLVGRINRLMEMFGTTDGCSAPPPHPPVTPTDDIDCKIASYLVRTVAKESMLAAIDFVVNPVGDISLLARILAFIPGVDGFIGELGLAQKDLAGIIGANIGLPWADTAAEAALWDLIGCTVYDGIKGVHQFTDATLGGVISAIESLGVAFPAFLAGVAGLFGSIGADALNAIAELSNVTDYDCSGCTDSTPVIAGSDPTTLVAKPLAVTDGVTTITDTSSITFAGATVSGSAGIATVAGLQGAPGVPGATGAQGAQGVPGETGLQGAQGAQGAQGPQGAVSAGAAVAAFIGHNIALTVNEWTSLVTIEPVSGTYDAVGVADIWNQNGADTSVSVRVMAGDVVVGSAEGVVAYPLAESISTPHGPYAVDGTVTFTLKAFTTAEGMWAVASTQEEPSGNATGLALYQPGIGPVGAPGPTGPVGAGLMTAVMDASTTAVDYTPDAPANTWITVGPTWDFTKALADTDLLFSVSGNIEADVTYNAYFATRLLVDDTVAVRLCGNFDTRAYANMVAGAGLRRLTGMAAGAHTFVLQCWNSVGGGSYFLRCASNAAYEWLDITVFEPQPS